MNNIRRLLTRMMRLLVTASDTGPWWQRDQWNPVEDNRIPLRDHEPMGRYSVRFDRIGTRWLRCGLQWHCKVGLDTGVLSWSTVHRRIVAVHEFDGFLAGRGVDGPWSADHPAGMRALMLDFLGHLRARPVTRGRRTGQRLSPASVQRLASDVEQFYLFMTDNKDTAAAALAEPGLAATRTRARRLLPAWRTARQAAAPTRRPGHRQRRHDPDHGRAGPARRRGRRRRVR